MDTDASTVQPRMRRTTGRALRLLLVFGCLVGLSGVWVAIRGSQARADLLGAAVLARQLSEQFHSGDMAAARRTLTILQQRTASARAATSGPGWNAAGLAPYIGDDALAVAEVAATMDDIARLALPPLLELDPSALLPVGGRLHLGPLQAAAARLTAADAAIHRIGARLAAIPTENLVPQVGEAVAQLRGEVSTLSALVATARRTAVLLPPLLGADGARTHLLLFQNLAEARSTGGMFGAYVVIRADRGKVRIIDQGAAGADLKAFDRPVLPLDPDMAALYTQKLGIYPADVNLTPHFPTAARLYREMYRRRTGTTVDTVLATDPVALAYLLRSVGPVRVPAGPPLTEANAVRTLLSDTYLSIDSAAEQDRYFAAATRAVFEALTRRTLDSVSLREALDRAVAERRILVWSSRAEEQAAMADTQLAGAMPQRESVPTVGVFINDGSGAKLGYYLTSAAELTVGQCRPDGRRELQLRLTVGSTAPESGLSASVLGLGLAGDPYTARAVVYIFSPAGGSVVRAWTDERNVAMGTGVERGRHVGAFVVDVPPGQVRDLQVLLLTRPAPTSTAQLWLSPGVTPWRASVQPAQSCD